MGKVMLEVRNLKTKYVTRFHEDVYAVDGVSFKIEECTSSDGYRKQSAEARSVLLALNIADDYFKAKKQGGALESDIEAKDKEMYDLKHELISVQIKYENAEKALDKLKAENQELQMKIVQLETEMKNHRTK